MMKNQENIEKIKKVIIEHFQPYDPKYISIFGSYARGEADKESDIDLLVDFEKALGLRFFGLAEELEEKLGRKVDLQTPRSISKYIKPYIQEDLEVIYEKR